MKKVLNKNENLDCFGHSGAKSDVVKEDELTV